MANAAVATGVIDSAAAGFEGRTMVVLARLRGAIEKGLAEVGGIQKSNDIQKRFGQSFNVSWQIYRILRADHLMEISPHIPTRKPMKKLLAALAAGGVSPGAIEEIDTAFEEFERFVREASGDRSAFEAMTTRTIGGVTDSQVEQVRRKEVFDAYRYMLGFEQDLYVGCHIFHPNAAAEQIDSVQIRIRKNMRRLRSDVPMRVDAAWALKDDGVAPVSHKRIPLDDEAFVKHGIYLLPEFCSQRELPLERIELPSGYMITKWNPEGVGPSSGLDLAIGSLHTDITWKINRRSLRFYRILTNVLTPTRRYISDVVIHRSLLPLDFEITQWYLNDPISLGSDFREMGVPEVPCNERMVSMRGIEGGTLAELPNYLKMIRKYCEKFGWKPEEMMLYRMRMEYPILHVMQSIDVMRLGEAADRG